jgi:hypothetical protein
LTERASQTNVEERSRVPSHHQPGSLNSVLRVCVPLLLIGLLLYNPFLALVSHDNGLAYQQLQRHRATVGASELQHFSPVQAESAQLEAVLVELFTNPAVAAADKFSSHQFQTEALPPRLELINRIWFRPPPSA